MKCLTQIFIIIIFKIVNNLKKELESNFILTFNNNSNI